MGYTGRQDHIQQEYHGLYREIRPDTAGLSWVIQGDKTRYSRIIIGHTGK
jgi:hypothetical protein